MNNSRSLKSLIQEPGTFIVPGAYNALTAKLIEEIGFKAAYVTGAGLSNSMLGYADVGLISYKEMLESIRYIVDAVEIPVFADADTGYGNVANVIRTVREYERAGLSGLHIEDQELPKRCGHFAGKQVVPKEEMIGKIKAALDTRVNSEFLIIARTDARAVNGLDDALERAAAYIEAGADMTFVEAPQSKEELMTITRVLKAPQIANMVEHGKTPIIPENELCQMGYKLVLYANLVLRATVKSCQEVLESLKRNGSSLEVFDKIITMDERNRITELEHINRLVEKYDSNI